MLPPKLRLARPLSILVKGCATALSTLAIASTAGAAGGGGGGGGAGGVAGGEAGTASRTRMYEKIAADKYDRARGYIDRALAYDAKVELATDEDERAKLEGKALQSYRRALRNLRSSVSREPDYHKAHSDMGFVHRRLGDYEKALESYALALEVEPDYWPAVEYRGEAYLELGRIDDAKQAYMRLFANERALADELMVKMTRWVERSRTSPGGRDPKAVEAFSAWVVERDEIASQTASLVGSGARGW
jgi:tetratricopeptide (TPR) repeat protein